MKKLLFCLTIALPLMSFANPELDAKLKAIDEAESTCLNSEGGQSTMGMKECSGQAFEQLDALLNSEYRKITDNLSKKTGDEYVDKDNKETLKRLREAQRDWVKFRDSNSSLASIEMLGGTGEGLIYIGSVGGMTKARILEIDQIINGR